MVMQEQSRRLGEPLQWGKREKSAIAAVLVCLVVGLVALGIHTINTKNGAEPANCIRVTFASTLGGADLHGCGAKARQICASGDFPHIAAELQAACTRAGFPYRAAAG
ncbi:MAG: hypothetical protein ACYDHN_10915 [Solirubrobacteraceae bacterium]